MLPTNEEATRLRNLFSEHITYHDEDLVSPWKGPISATVSEDLAPDMRQAMGFMGCAVDHETVLPDGHIVLYSKGYYYHVGA